LYEAAEERAAAQTESMIEKIMELPSLSSEEVAAIDARIGERQKSLGYADYNSWIAKITPPDLE
jgi:hypothetical protein